MCLQVRSASSGPLHKDSNFTFVNSNLVKRKEKLKEIPIQEKHFLKAASHQTGENITSNTLSLIK